jgi:hypothetical protein
VIGEVDFSSALTTVHPRAIYIHQGLQYHVEHLDFERRKAYVKPVNVDYFTDAIRYTQVRVLEVAEEETIAGPAAHAHGDVLVRSQVVGFKKIKFFTNENVGSGKLELPENEMHTTSFWLTLGHSLLADLAFSLSERQSGIFGLLYALGSVATLLMMCDRRDLGTAVGERPPSAATEIDWEDFAAPANQDDAKLLDLAGYEPVNEIAERLGRSERAVRFRLGALGMSARVTDGWSQCALRKLLRMSRTRLRQSRRQSQLPRQVPDFADVLIPDIDYAVLGNKPCRVADGLVLSAGNSMEDVVLCPSRRQFLCKETRDF